MSEETSGTRGGGGGRGTLANQIALICRASGKNVNARRPLVIQSQLRGLPTVPSPPLPHSLPPVNMFLVTVPLVPPARRTVALICGFMFGFAF